MSISTWLRSGKVEKKEVAKDLNILREFRAYLRLRGINADKYTEDHLRLLLKGEASAPAPGLSDDAAKDQAEDEVQQAKGASDPRVAKFREFLQQKGEDDSQLTDEQIAELIGVPTTPAEKAVEQLRKRYKDDPNIEVFVNQELDAPAILDKTNGKVQQGFEMFSEESYRQLFGDD